ncbi:MAG: NTP transferase domain-containing protein [Gemmatimonadetes bacterium]|nr:NTP transferase domain-containing protein [Gemmatimonadota bacterium]
MSRWVVVLAGGVGSRFWPLSTPERPKQLLPLITGTPLLAETLLRLQPLADAEHTLILTNASLVDAIRELLPSVPAANVIAEPRPAGTAAALAWAAHVIAARDPDGVMLSVHADWAIGDADGFRRALVAAAEAAEQHHALVTVGVLPVRPDPGFGYIQPGEVVAGALRRVRRFAEKPNRERAAEMIRDGYLWNSGIFVWRAKDFLAEVEALTPEVAPALAAHGDDIAAFFGAVTSIAVDVGVLERSQRVMVLPGDFGWDDIGTWEALARVRQLDHQGNAAQGSVFPVESARNVVHAEEGDVVLYGVSDLVVVTCRGMTLVTTTARAAELKLLIDQLPATVRTRA